MPTNFMTHQKYVHSNPIFNDEEGDDEEETLSLCDLPIHQPLKEEAKTQPIVDSQQNFNFHFSPYISTESQMSAADELFFRGQMLPLRRHSISSDMGLSRFTQNPTRLVSRSESMDHYHSGGFTSFSSRSSSSSSGSTSTATINTVPKCKPRVLNQFHSHPSPNPKIRNPTRPRNVTHQSQKSTIWRFFQVGLLKTPEIELSDLKVVRNNNNLNGSFSSRNSSESACSSEKKVKKKKQKGLFDRNGRIFGGCKCSVNSVETVKFRVVISVKEMSEKEGKEKEKLMKKKKEKSVSRHNRTFEWLKQLSLEGGGGCGPHEV
ncbi:hypothetical protein LguiA_017616 [Lonicera macranthoides]